MGSDHSDLQCGGPVQDRRQTRLVGFSAPGSIDKRCHSIYGVHQSGKELWQGGRVRCRTRTAYLHLFPDLGIRECPVPGELVRHDDARLVALPRLRNFRPENGIRAEPWSPQIEAIHHTLRSVLSEYKLESTDSPSLGQRASPCLAAFALARKYEWQKHRKLPDANHTNSRLLRGSGHGLRRLLRGKLSRSVCLGSRCHGPSSKRTEINAGSRWMLSGKHRSRNAVDAVNVVFDAENFRAVESYVHGGLVPCGKPKVADFFELAHEIGPCDPKGKILCRMAGNSDDREFLALNPYLSFEKILVAALGNGFNHETVVWAEVFFAEQTKGVVRGGDGAIATVLSRGSGGFAFHQAVEHQTADNTRAFLRNRHERLFVRGDIVHPHRLLRANFAVEIGYSIGSYRGVFPQSGGAYLIVFQEISKNLFSTRRRFHALERL